MFTACEYDIVSFGDKQANVSFSQANLSINEADEYSLMVPVALARIEDGTSVTVSIAVDAELSTAIEGTDFTFASGKTLTFSKGAGIGYIEIVPKNNEVFTGDKMIVLTIAETSIQLAPTTANTAYIVLVDDEHPLKPYLGTYTVSTTSGYDGVPDYSFDIEVTTDTEDATKLWISNWYTDAYGLSIDGSFYMVIDQDAKTATIPMGQQLESGYGLSELGLYFGEVPEFYGVINDDYSIDFTGIDDYFMISIIAGDNEGIVFDYYYGMVWTKQ